MKLGISCIIWTQYLTLNYIGGLMMFRSGNPLLNENTFRSAEHAEGQMTVAGTVNKTGILLALVLVGAVMTWSSTPSSISGLAMLGGVGGFVLALVTTFKKQISHITAPLYAMCQGWFLGGLSSLLEVKYPGIAFQAVALTFGTMFCLLAAYRSGIVKVTDNFRLGLFAATGGIALVYLVALVLGFFGIPLAIFQSGLIGILFSFFVVGIAALNLVMDFDFIEDASNQGAPKYMEWFGAFGLIVTLIWLYVEILRLLSKLRDERR